MWSLALPATSTAADLHRNVQMIKVSPHLRGAAFASAQQFERIHIVVNNHLKGRRGNLPRRIGSDWRPIT